MLLQVTNRITDSVGNHGDFSMTNIHEELVLLDQALNPQIRWMLSAFLTVFALHFAVDFGEKLGKALYYLSH